MVGLSELTRRVQNVATGRLRSLPILALSVHSGCNCRCVMCDIWKANADKREISSAELEEHIDAIRRLHVQRVMLTGGEPLLHGNLWELCDRLRGLGIGITLVTTGLLLERHAAAIATSVDTVVISVDGDEDTHDAVRRVPGALTRIAKGVSALRSCGRGTHVIARSVVQRLNMHGLADTIVAAHRMGFDEISFLAADVSTTAFNRPEPWTQDRVLQVAPGAEDLAALRQAIDYAHARCRAQFENGFVVGGRASLERIVRFYAALAGQGTRPTVRCNAPWMSAVLEPGGAVRPCFFHDPYEPAGDLEATVNSRSAIAYRRRLDVASNETCTRCVCSLELPLLKSV